MDVQFPVCAHFEIRLFVLRASAVSDELKSLVKIMSNFNEDNNTNLMRSDIIYSLLHDGARHPGYTACW